MSRWEERLVARLAERHSVLPPEAVTDRTAETQDLAVLSVPMEASDARPEQRRAEPDGPYTLRARRLPEGDRTLLDCLVWLQPDTGALTAKELALASRMPLGQVLGALGRLKSLGLVLPSGRAFRVGRVLMRELGVSDPDGQLLNGAEHD